MLAPKQWMVWMLMLLFICGFTADETGVKTITQKLDAYRKKYPQEKVHLHFDKSYYSIGDTIYFTAYVVNEEKNTPSVISNILYVDVINDSNQISQTIKIPVADGIAPGTIDLGDSLREGNYAIRAYTNWMRNFDEAFFFYKKISIGDGLHDEVVLNPSFLLAADGNKSRDSLSLQYTSLRNVSMEGKEVSYSFVINKKERGRGKGVIGKGGKLTIGLGDVRLPEHQTVLLVTHSKMDNRITITKEVKIQAPSSGDTLLLFPEGGQMVAGITSRIGFKATTGDGLGIDVSGEIKDDSTEETIPFQSRFKGMGSFLFTPKQNHSYHATVTYKNGRKESVMMPAAVEQGFVLSVDNSGKEKVGVNVAASAENADSRMILVAQSGNRIQYAAPVLVQGEKASVAVSKNKFSTGIVQFTLFDSSLRPVAERLVFINHHDELFISLSTDKREYSKREKVSLQLAVKDKDGNPVEGTFSLSVTDANTSVKDDEKEQTILSDLLLSSDIKGYIENPNHYFINVDEEKESELDNLLLTQGWRRFLWPNVLNESYPVASFAKEKSLTVSGKVVSPKGAPVAHSEVLLLPKKGEGFVLDTLTDANGRFAFDELNFSDAHPFVVQAFKTEKEKIVDIKLDSFDAPPVPADNKLATTASDVTPSYLYQKRQQYDEMKKYGLLPNSHTLKEVVVTTSQLSQRDEAVAGSANLNGPGHADQILTYADLNNCHELGICLQGKLIGVFFKMVPEDETARVKIYRMLPFSSSSSGKPMMVVIDGVELPPGSGGLDIRNIPVQNIQSIEVLRSGGYTSIYGFRGAGGVLIITTKHGEIDYNAVNDIKQKKQVQNLVFTTAKGYSSCRQFYTPDYSKPTQLQSPVHDLRSTIFWKPIIVTGEDGKATVEWYNGDNTGDCNIVIEGLSPDGKMGRAIATYEVK